MGEQGKAATWVLLCLGHPTCTVGSDWRASSLLLGCAGAGSEQCCVSGLPFLLQALRDHSPEPSGAWYRYPPQLCPGWLSEVTGKESRACARAVSDTGLELHEPCQSCVYTKIPIQIRTFRGDPHQCSIFWFSGCSSAVPSDTPKIPWSILSITAKQCFLLLWQVFSRYIVTCTDITEILGVFTYTKILRNVQLLFVLSCPISLLELDWKSLWDITSSTKSFL